MPTDRDLAIGEAIKAACNRVRVPDDLHPITNAHNNAVDECIEALGSLDLRSLPVDGDARDGERLDWMEQNRAMIAIDLFGTWTEVITVGVRIGIIERDSNMLATSGRWRGNTLRAAIDAALRKEGQ